MTSESVEFHAKFVQDVVPDGTNIKPGEYFTKVWSLRNSGSSKWPVNLSLQPAIDKPKKKGQTYLEWDSKAYRLPALRPGEIGMGACRLKAPLKEGKYESVMFRVTAGNGIQFGDYCWTTALVTAKKQDGSSKETDRSRTQALFIEQNPTKLPKKKGELSEHTIKLLREEGVNEPAQLKGIKEKELESFISKHSLPLGDRSTLRTMWKKHQSPFETSVGEKDPFKVPLERKNAEISNKPSGYNLENPFAEQAQGGNESNNLFSDIFAKPENLYTGWK